ncbi:MAG: folate-binding protein [gamma proteobacterium symbiont of Bathyaustriella thionipta]|nr:folate-binding protein [gamma proteobacterium symbiont of Bathyaustriella thionipta]
MNPQWQAFLLTQGASFDAAGRAQFAASDQHSECLLADLSWLGTISAEGADTSELLQGQLTSDVRELSDKHSLLAGLCNPKGRVLACFRLFQTSGGEILLQAPGLRIQPMLKRLGMFVLRADARFTDVSDERISLGLMGENVSAVIASVFGIPAPDNENDVMEHDGMLLARIGADRVQLIVPAARAQACWQQLSQQATPVSSDEWSRRDILAGLPTVYDETSEAFVPQMLNLQRVEAISFTKGCYTGQEVVARMQYLGKLKRRMYIGHVDTDQRPQAGDEVFSPDSASGQGAGKLVDARPAPQGGYDLLAVVEVKSAQADNVHLGSLDGALISLHEPPYGFEEETG